MPRTEVGAGRVGPSSRHGERLDWVALKTRKTAACFHKAWEYVIQRLLAFHVFAGRDPFRRFGGKNSFKNQFKIGLRVKICLRSCRHETCRIMESLRLEKTSEIITSNRQPMTTVPAPGRVLGGSPWTSAERELLARARDKHRGHGRS